MLLLIWECLLYGDMRMVEGMQNSELPNSLDDPVLSDFSNWLIDRKIDHSKVFLDPKQFFLSVLTVDTAGEIG
jgi:hypothetical protein